MTQEVRDALYASLQTLERTKWVYEAIIVNELLNPADEIVTDDLNKERMLDQIAQAHAVGDRDAKSDEEEVDTPKVTPLAALQALSTLRTWAEGQSGNERPFILELESV